MVIKLYTMDCSPVARTVYITINALGIDELVKRVKVDLLKEEHLQDSFLKINPQHTVPTLDDNGKILWDSHAINIYLITKYGKDNSSLYPKDPYTRACIDQRLHFDSGIMFALVKRQAKDFFYKGIKTISEDMEQEFLEAYSFLEAFLQNSKWFVGDEPTLADIHLVTSVTAAEAMVPIDATKYAKLTAWLNRSKNLSYYKANEAGLNDYYELLEPFTHQNDKHT